MSNSQSEKLSLTPTGLYQYMFPFGDRSRIHVLYMSFALALVMWDLISFHFFGKWTQTILFVMLFVGNVDMKQPLNLFHGGVVIFHNWIHQSPAYFTICETGKITVDETWHVLYILFLSIRVRKSLHLYKRVILGYVVLTAAVFLLEHHFWKWLIYTVGTALAYQLVWLESGSPANGEYWFWFAFHTLFAFSITFDNPIGRFFLNGVPGGSAFYSEALIYGIIASSKAHTA